MRFEEAEQLGLEVEADVADLVEEEGAARGGADDAGERDLRAGERALAVAEQLALEHVARDRGAVERVERAVGAVGRAMDDAREHLLAGAGLAREQDRDRCGGDAPGDREELGGLLGDPEALGVSVEGLCGPQRGALLLVPPVVFERARRRDQLADGGEGAVMVEGRPGAGQNLPGLVAVLTERR